MLDAVHSLYGYQGYIRGPAFTSQYDKYLFCKLFLIYFGTNDLQFPHSLSFSTLARVFVVHHAFATLFCWRCIYKSCLSSTSIQYILDVGGRSPFISSSLRNPALFCSRLCCWTTNISLSSYRSFVRLCVHSDQYKRSWIFRSGRIPSPASNPL